MQPTEQPPDNPRTGLPAYSRTDCAGAPGLPPSEPLANPFGSTLAGEVDRDRFADWRRSPHAPHTIPPMPDRHCARLDDEDGPLAWLRTWLESCTPTGTPPPVVAQMIEYVDDAADYWVGITMHQVTLDVHRCVFPAPWSGHPYVYGWLMAANGRDRELGDVWLTGPVRPVLVSCGPLCPTRHQRAGRGNVDEIAPQWGQR